MKSLKGGLNGKIGCKGMGLVLLFGLVGVLFLGNFGLPKEARAETNQTEKITALASGQSHMCALNSAGVVRCWGGNYGGQIGDGTRFDRFLPVDPLGPAIGVTAIGAGLSSTCAITGSKEVQCWPGRDFGGASLRPVVIPGITMANPPTQVSVGGGGFACAVFLR